MDDGRRHHQIVTTRSAATIVTGESKRISCLRNRLVLAFDAVNARGTRGLTQIVGLGISLRFDDRQEVDAKARQRDAAGRAERLQVVETLLREIARADHDAVDRRGGHGTGRGRIPARHGIPLHANAGFSRMVVDEADDPDVAAALAEKLANDKAPAVAGTVDDDAGARAALPLNKLACEPERCPR